jgi:hypothetical protein
MLLEGEGRSVHGPNLYPGSFEELYLHCIMGLNFDDLIYDILIKTIEIRSRIMVFRCVAGRYGLSDEAREIGGVAHGLLTRYLGRENNEAESAETQSGYMRGAHLRGLLHVQRERLAVWISHLSMSKGQPPGPDSPILTRIRTHRDAMNALYSLLCETMFDEAEAETIVDTPASSFHSYAQKFIHILSTLDMAASITSDIYTFSLTEVLLQLVQCCKSPSLFTYILDRFWPLLETKGRGYEHSHYPTHLVKRMIGLIAAYWEQGREIKLVLPALSEDVPKMRLLDIYSEVGVVVCGWDGQREREGKGERCFFERVRLP